MQVPLARDEISGERALALLTYRIESRVLGGTTISTGTGFRYNFITKDGVHYPALITNKHVIKSADYIWMRSHASDLNGQVDLAESHPISILLSKDTVIPHPDSQIDLCAVLFEDATRRPIEMPGVVVFSTTARRNDLATVEMLTEMSVCDDVVMIGYPTGLFDSVHNLPLFRRGIISTEPRISFCGRREFLVDMACFPGSSGSPVFRYSKGVHSANGSLVVGTTCTLIGVLYAGPQYSASGEVIPIQNQLGDRSRTSIPMNLGYVIPSTCIAELEDVALNELHRRNEQLIPYFFTFSRATAYRTWWIQSNV